MVINGEIKFLDREVTRMAKKIKQSQSSMFERTGPQNNRHQEEVFLPVHAPHFDISNDGPPNVLCL